MKLNVKKLNKNAIIPTKENSTSAALDLYACTKALTVIAPNTTLTVNTGISVEIPDGFVGLIIARDDLARKQGIAPAYKVGLINSDYVGEIVVALHNHGSVPQVMQPMERIAQLMVIPYVPVTAVEVK